MKHNLFIRFLSFVLVLALMLQIIPAQALAVFAEPAAEVSASQEPAANENSVSVVGEIDELRSETTKHFRLSDGSNIAVNYGVPVHYQDETGSWKDMDASVIREEGEGGGRYRFSNNGHTVSFSETLSSGTIFTATHEDVSVSMSLLDEGELAAAAEESAAAPDSVTPSAKSERKSYSRTSTAHWEESDMSFREQKGGNGLDHRELISDSFRKSLRYENVYPDTDLCYTTYGGSIKEQILVNAPQESYRYDFLLELEGLTAALNDDGSVSLLDAECKEVYSIPAPYMEDSAGNFSEAVQYALTETEKGTVLSVEADAQWINAEGRAFPVMIDPTLKESATASKKKIYTTYVSEAAPTESFYDQTSQYSGVKDSSAFEYRTFMHFEALPEVPAGSVIINAYLSYFLNYSIFSDLTELNIGAYEVTGDKPDTATYLSWFQGLTWNNQPAYNSSNIIDYAKLTGSSGSEYINWDLTELVKRWYAENKDNKTIALVATDADSHTSSSYSYAKFLSSYCPVMYVTYRSTIGMESYYTYASLGAGAAGSAYIADATGQLTIARELVGYASTINPVNVNLVYNSDYFSSSSITSHVPPEELGLNMDLGHGWTLDVIQKIEDDPIGDIKYKKYTDGDGTVHYFQQDRTKDPTGKYYYDEDGLGLKIEETSTNCYILSDDSGNQWHFVNNFLIAVEDSNENFIRINYADGRLTTVSQINKGNDEYRVATFEYAEDDANRLVKVTDAAGVVYDLVYDNNRLFEIHRNGVAIARYVYMGNRVRKLTDVESNYSLYFAYDTNGRIGSYQELVGVAPDTGSTGAAVSVEHPDYEKTLYRDHGADRTEKTDDDILTYYIFDNAGRTVNAYTTDADNNILGASSAVYFQNSETDKRNNRTLRTSTIGVTGQQLIRNGGFESTSDSLAWTLNNFTLVQANPRTGTKSLRTILTGEHTVYAKRMSEALEAGKTYTFSVYVNTVEVEDFLGKGVYLQVTDTSGNKWVSEPIAHTTYNAMDGGWLRLNLTFTAQNDGKHTLSIYNHGATGMLYVDDVQLEEGEAPSSHNLVENGSMEMDGYPWIRASGNETYSTEEHIGGSYSMKVVGDPAKLTTRFFQDIPLNLPGTETYVLAGWAKANAVPDNVTEAEDADADTQKQFGLRAVIFYTDDTAETHYTAFSASTDEWQYTSAAIVPEESSKTVEKIRLFCTYEGNANVAYFDNIALLREAARTMRYDEEGNLISVTTTGMAADENGYDTENRLSQITTAGNGTYSYAYDNEYHPFSPTSVTLKDKDGNTVLTESVVYTATGNVKSTTLSGTGKWSLESSATYAESNRVVTATDANGSTVSYGYAEKKNKVTGLPSSVTDALGTLTHTSYDENNRVSRTWIANTANLVYNYTKGNLSSVERTDIDYDSATNTSSYTHQTYNFTYDIWGNMLTTSVGGHTLATNTYYDGNGNLKSQTYANGDSVSYTYDDLGRIKTATYSDGRTLEYIYSGEGYLHSIVETEDGVTTNDQFRYDSIGRITDSQRSIDGTIYTVEDWKYNMYNQLMRQSWKVDGATYTELYTYNNDGDGSLATVTLDGATPVTRTYGYDSLRRLSSITGTVNARKYLYRNIDDDTSTNQVASLSYTGLTGTPAFQYTYDANGNIKTYAAPDSAVVTYTYDAQGQLTEATDGTTTYTYTYDNVGNILTASNGYKNHTYTYSTDNWKDLLTKYDGETITYDASGNPTSYYNGTRWTFGWENGRELASATNGTTNITYDYDANGLRTKKVVDGVTYTYLYDSSRQLRRMTFKGNILDFFYEADGTPNALKFNGTFFYYVTNLQGDVVGIVDGDGNDAATYAYDPYGKLIGGGSSGETDTLQPLVSVAEVNPLRYRGYVYDNETGLYYVSSRYYDPEIGRWINTDTTDVLSLPYYHPGQYNLFSYCNNNPVNDRDDDGQLSWLAKIAIGAAAIAIGVGVTALTGGAALPALVAGVKAACVAGAISAGTSAATTAVRSAVSGDSFSTVVQKSAKAAVDGFADGFMAGGIAAGASQVASGGFKIAAKLGAKTGKNGGIKIGNTKILSPDAAWHKNNGGTLLKIGKTFRIDVGSNSLLHMHLPNVSSHIQIGTIGAGICGGLK